MIWGKYLARGCREPANEYCRRVKFSDEVTEIGVMSISYQDVDENNPLYKLLAVDTVKDIEFILRISLTAALWKPPGKNVFTSALGLRWVKVLEVIESGLFEDDLHACLVEVFPWCVPSGRQWCADDIRELLLLAKEKR